MHWAAQPCCLPADCGSPCIHPPAGWGLHPQACCSRPPARMGALGTGQSIPTTGSRGGGTACGGSGSGAGTARARSAAPSNSCQLNRVRGARQRRRGRPPRCLAHLHCRSSPLLRLVDLHRLILRPPDHGELPTARARRLASRTQIRVCPAAAPCLAVRPCKGRGNQVALIGDRPPVLLLMRARLPRGAQNFQGRPRPSGQAHRSLG